MERVQVYRRDILDHEGIMPGFGDGTAKAGSDNEERGDSTHFFIPERLTPQNHTSVGASLLTGLHRSEARRHFHDPLDCKSHDWNGHFLNPVNHHPGD